MIILFFRAVNFLFLSGLCIGSIFLDVDVVFVSFIPILASIEYIFCYGSAFWRNSSFVLMIFFSIYNLIYYYVVPFLPGSVFYGLPNDIAFGFVKQAVVLVCLFSFFFHRFFVVDSSSTVDANIYGFSFKKNIALVIVVFLISFIFIFPFATNYRAIISASSKLQVDEYMSWFPYVKQLMTSVFIVVYMIFCANRRYIYNSLVFFLPLACLLLMLFLGGRKELLILVLFVVYSNLSRVSDGKMMLMALAVVIFILSLGVFRAGVERAGGDNDFVNFFGEFIYSHSVLPFSISDAKLFKSNISSYWGVILFFIPNALLPDKPIPPSYEISESLSYIFDGVGLGFNPLAEAYLTFGVWAPLGCLIILVVLLVFFKKLNSMLPYSNVVFISSIANLMRFDIKSYFVETMFIILSVNALLFLLRVRLVSKHCFG